jgi:1-acyl-sn-glycerol-3-phosphate acyltransferase
VRRPNTAPTATPTANPAAAARNRRFRRGAARVALTTGAPLVPVRLFGTADAFRIVPPRLGFPKLRVVVGEPLPVERQEPSLEAATRLTEELESAIAALAPAPTPPTPLTSPAGFAPRADTRFFAAVFSYSPIHRAFYCAVEKHGRDCL